MQASRAVVWLLENFHCRKTGGEPDGCVNPTREHVTAGAGSASLSATSPVGTLVAAAGVSSARFFLGGRFPRRHSWTRLSVLFAELLHVAASLTERRLRCARRLRCGPARRPHRRLPRCAHRRWNPMFDVDVAPPPHTRHIRHPKSPGTQRARAARPGVTGACAFTSGGSPGDHPGRSQVHTQRHSPK